MSYTVSGKTCHYIFASNFAKYWPIFKTLSPTDLAVNVCSKAIIKYTTTHQMRLYTTSWNVCTLKLLCCRAEWSELTRKTLIAEKYSSNKLAPFSRTWCTFHAASELQKNLTLKLCLPIIHGEFYPRDAMIARYMLRHCVRLSVCHKSEF